METLVYRCQYARTPPIIDGALAVVLGLAGFARREDRRTCAVAAVLGLAALPWQLALAVALAVLFFAASAAMLRGRT
jgi:hypothetical protein